MKSLRIMFICRAMTEIGPLPISVTAPFPLTPWHSHGNPKTSILLGNCRPEGFALKLGRGRRSRISSAVMKRSVNVALATCIATSIVLIAGPAQLAHADPADPQPGVSCGKSAGVMDGGDRKST